MDNTPIDLKVKSNFFSEKDFSFYMDNFPVVCVDIVFFDKTKTKTLLFKRKNKPELGTYYTMGGRLLKNENLEDAVTRKVKEEIGLDVDKSKLTFGGVISEIHKDSIFAGVNYHGVTLYWGYTLEDDSHIRLDNQHEEYKWFDVSDDSIHPFVKERIDVCLSKMQ